MANLLNAIPQASNKLATSPSSLDKNPAKLESSELKKLFDKKLSDKISSNSDSEKPLDAESDADLGEVALAAGAGVAPKVVTPDLKNQVQEKTAVAENVKNLVKTPNKDNIVLTAAQAELIKNAKLAASAGKASAVDGESGVAPTDIATLLGGMDLNELSKDHEFDVESIDLKNVDSKDQPAKAATSKLSTSDFLNLREISQNATKANLVAAASSPALTEVAQLVPMQASGAVIGMKPTAKKLDEKQNLSAALSGLAPAHQEQQVFGKTLDATVSQANGQKPVLTAETVNQIGNQVNLLGQARQDGEIKIRLRPDHLGELQMSVRTQGQNVSVQIKAENNEAKRIIEDSLGALREHLEGQNLSLSRIDVVVQPSGSSNLEQSQMNFDSNQSFNQSSTQQGERNNSQDGSSQSGREFYRDEPGVVAGKQATMIRPRSNESTRLDLIA